MIIDRPECEQIPQLRSLWKQAFGDSDAFLDAFFSVGFSFDRSLCITEQGTVAAALYWFDCLCCGQKVAYVYAVATERSFQGRGLCHALMEKLHALLAERGYTGAILVPGNTRLFRFYETMGYHVFGGKSEFAAVSEAPGVDIHKISGEEYAALRKKRLPVGSVLQEGELLAFLETQVSFYAGQDFILAASIDGGRLFVPEFLGDISVAGRVVTALGARQGVFRVQGSEPFAMYRPLCAEQAPAYFGFALD